MRILHRYILSNFLVTFAMSMAVLTFVMMVGLVFESLKYIARGMDAMLVVRFLWQNLPGTLSYSVPVSLLVSSLLVFSRLSSDSEISAMRSCGVPLASIMRTPVLLAALLALVCLHVNDNVSPDAAYTRALRRKAFKAKDVMALLEPRTWISMGEYEVFVARRDGEDLLDLRSRGIGTELIRAAKAYGKAHGADFMRTQVFPQNVDGMRFYERKGYSVFRDDGNRFLLKKDIEDLFCEALREKGNNGRRYFEKNFTKEQSISKLETIIS